MTTLPNTTPRDHATLFEVAESWIVGLVALLIAFETAVGAVLILIDLPTASFHLSRWISIPIAAILIPSNLWTVFAIYRSLRTRHHALGPNLATFILGWSTLLRRASAVAWAINIALTLFAAFGMTGAAHSMGSEIGPAIGIALIAAAATLLANVYLALLLTSLTSRPDAALAFWKYRLLVDGLLTVTVLLITLSHPAPTAPRPPPSAKAPLVPAPAAQR